MPPIPDLPDDDRPTRVYLDGSAVVGPQPDVPARLAPEAEPALRHLLDAGCELVLLAEGPLADETRRALDGRVALAVTPDADVPGWLVAGDAATCAAARSGRRLRTVLVGPSVPGRGLAARPCDVEARSLIDAVLAILTAEAMPPRDRTQRRPA